MQHVMRFLGYIFESSVLGLGWILKLDCGVHIPHLVTRLFSSLAWGMGSTEKIYL